MVRVMSAGSLCAAAREARAALKLSALDCLPDGFMRLGGELVALLPALIGELQRAVLATRSVTWAVTCYTAVVVSITGVSGVVE